MPCLDHRSYASAEIPHGPCSARGQGAFQPLLLQAVWASFSASGWVPPWRGVTGPVLGPREDLWLGPGRSVGASVRQSLQGSCDAAQPQGAAGALTPGGSGPLSTLSFQFSFPRLPARPHLHPRSPACQALSLSSPAIFSRSFLPSPLHSGRDALVPAGQAAFCFLFRRGKVGE